MKRFISILLALVLLFSIDLPSQAEDSTAFKLKTLGLLSNITDGELNASLTRDVGMTMILKAIGYTQEDANLAMDNGYFTDVDDWAEGWTELAYVEGITTGVGGHRFNPRGYMSEKEFVVFMLRALEYDTETTWDNALMFGSLAGLVESGNGLDQTRLTKNEAAVIMYKALNATLQEQDRSLINVLIEEDIVAQVEAELQGLIPDEFELISNKHTNFKEVVFKFSKSINMATVTKETLVVYKDDEQLVFDSDIYNGTGSLSYGVELINNETLRLVFGTAFNTSDQIEIDFLGIQSLDGEVLNNSEKFIIRDVLKPKVTSVTAINEARIEVLFSEGVQMKMGSMTYQTILIDDQAMVGNLSFNYDRKVMILNLDASLSEGDHTISLSGAADYAGKEMDVYEGEIMVINDTSAPIPINAELINNRTLSVEFDESINDKEGYVVVDGTSYDLQDLKIREALVTIELDDSIEGLDSLVVECYEIEDLIGNIAERSSVQVVIPDDQETPTLLIRGLDSEEIVLIFSEAVNHVDRNHVVVRNNSGGLLPTLSISASDDAKGIYRLLLGESMSESKAYYVEIQGISDQSVNENTMPKAFISVGVEDTNTPKVDSVNQLDNGKVRVSYSEQMNETFTGSLSYYYFYDASRMTAYNLEDIEGASVNVGGDGVYADLTVPSIGENDQIMVLKVRDRLGNKISGYGSYLSFEEVDEFGPTDITAELIDSKTIKVTLSGHEFDDINPYDIKFKGFDHDFGYIYVKSATFEDDDHSVVLLTLNTSMEDDATYLSQKQYLYTDNSGDTTNIYGVPLEINDVDAVMVEDLLRPEIETDGDSDGIDIEFSEMMMAKNNSAITEAIRLIDPEGESVTLKPGINLFYKGGDDFSYRGFDKLVIDGLQDEGTYTLKVYERNITDLNGNVNQGVSSVTFEVD